MTPTDPAAVRARLFDLLLGFMRTQALSVAARLGIADGVSDQPVHVDELAERVGAHGPSLYRLLRFLASEGIFAEVEPRRFAATPLTAGLRSDAPLTVHWLAIAFGTEHYRAWGEALHSFRSGEAGFDRAYGEPYFHFLAEHPEQSSIFGRAMAAGTQGRALALTSYDWNGVGRVADIGGGTGTAIASLLAANEHLRGALFDLPSVVAEAPAVLAGAGVTDRCDIVGGDFFSDPLPPADVYVLAQILHDWNDDHARTILANCRSSIREGGRLVIVDGVVPDGPEPHFFKLFDLHMLVLLGGKERTEAEWRELLAGEGFELERLSPFPPAFRLEARAA